jgi:hypothetical protein
VVKKGGMLARLAVSRREHRSAPPKSRSRAPGVGAAMLFAWFAASSCMTETPPSQPVFASVARSGPLRFRYRMIDGHSWLGSENLRGRPMVLGFLTTYDMASQAQARFLNAIAQRHGGRVQVAIVVLETAENRPLVIAFRDGLDLGYPVAMGDPEIISGEGPFGDVHIVPATVVLDAETRLVWKKLGIVREDEIEKVLREL